MLNEDNLTELQTHVKTLASENSYLRDKIEDAENRSRAYNLRFLHVPEKSEGQDILGFMKDLIQLRLGAENFKLPSVIERAHRYPITVQTNVQKPGPRPILVKLLSLEDKQQILRLSREKKELKYKSNRVHIFPDISAGLVLKRRQFDNIKKKLSELNMKYSLLYPASSGGSSQRAKQSCSQRPGDAESFIQDLETHSQK